MRRVSALVCVVVASLLAAGCSTLQGNASHPLLSKRIFVPDSNDMLINFHDLRERMRSYASKIEEPTGIYFEYLPTGVSIGVNQEHRFIGASLLKVPIVIGAYKTKNKGLIRFDDMIRITHEDIDPSFGRLWKMGSGHEITVREAVRLVLSESDNTARAALMRTLREKNPDFIQQAFDDLDIPMEVQGSEPVVSAENYSSVLRSLYLASSLPKDDAQEILDLLAKSPFDDKLRAGVPPDVPVSHKIGIYDVEGKTTHSDCGIVYAPLRPYLLCIMTQAPEQKAREYMSMLSRMAYDFVSTATVSEQ